MKSKHIVPLGLALLWTLSSCVFTDELLVQETAPVMEEEESTSTESSVSSSKARATLPGQYVVQPGDTLKTIAGSAGIYWNESLWFDIYNANRSKIANPDMILPGTVLLIPPLRGEIRESRWDANQYYENPFETR